MLNQYESKVAHTTLLSEMSITHVSRLTLRLYLGLYLGGYILTILAGRASVYEYPDGSTCNRCQDDCLITDYEDAVKLYNDCHHDNSLKSSCAGDGYAGEFDISNTTRHCDCPSENMCSCECFLTNIGDPHIYGDESCCFKPNSSVCISQLRGSK